MIGTTPRFAPLVGRAGVFVDTAPERPYTIFYTPGYVAVAPNDDAEDFGREIGALDSDRPVATALREYAATAISAEAALATRPFSPVCLTLYLHNECNLSCTYCFSQPTRPRTQAQCGPADRLNMDEIRAAARPVIQNCRAAGRTFTLVCHGGGEPSLYPAQLNSILDLIEAEAQAAGVPVFKYVATNGVCSASTARLLASRFDLVGLSCDGPPDVQNGQRPAWNGAGAAPLVERTARIVCEAGTPLHVRVTLLPAMMARQHEIAAYVCRMLQPEAIHVEPVYTRGHARDIDRPTDADVDAFVTGFERAREIAKRYAVAWSTSGSRLHELHGPYCNVFRGVVNLVPGGAATACFHAADRSQVTHKGCSVGGVVNGRLELSDKAISTLQIRLSALPAACGACFNRFHCARGCPSRCPLDAEMSGGAVDFFCAAQQKLAAARIGALAQELWLSGGARQSVRGTRVTIND